MNNVVLSGRLTADPRINKTKADTSVCSFTLAVERPTKEKMADFIPCVAWEKNADLLLYLEKGSRLAIVGSIQSKNYEGEDGKRVYTTEVVVNRVEFVDTKADKEARHAEGGQYAPKEKREPKSKGVDITDDESLPFDL